MGWNSVVVIVTRYGGTVRGSNPVGNDIFRTRPDRSFGPPNIPYNGYRILFSRIKRPERVVKHPRPSSDEVKERVIYTSTHPFGLHGLLRGEIYITIIYEGWLPLLLTYVCVCLKPVPLYEFCYTVKPSLQTQFIYIWQVSTLPAKLSPFPCFV